MNDNLYNLYTYNIIDYKITKTNLTKNVISQSSKYEKIMKGKWKNTKEQKDLKLNEDCITIIMLLLCNNN